MKTFFENRQIRHLPPDVSRLSDAAGNAGSTAVRPPSYLRDRWAEFPVAGKLASLTPRCLAVEDFFMRLNPALKAAALMCAASIIAPATAQDVPSPPPAGVKPIPRRTGPVDAKPAPTLPREAAPSQDAQPEPEVKSDSLPQIPDNAIRLENENSLDASGPAQRPDVAVPAQQPQVVVPQPDVNVPAQQSDVVPGSPGEPPVANRRSVTPKGPVYYYPVDPYTFPANVNTPPAMHVPNSPCPEDLSVNGDHGRYTYYSYRRPWYTPGHQSANVTIVW
jgi:hypothetical protein